MADPRNAQSSSAGREYTWPPTDERFVSVTTVLSVINKPALVNWAAKMCAQFAVENVESWKNLDPDAAVDLLKGAHRRNTNRAARLGTAVHEAAEAWSKGERMPVWAPSIAPRMRQFQNWLEEFQPEVEHSEVTVYHRAISYAGTADLIVWIGGDRVLVDIKTGKSVYGETELQLSAYANAQFIGMDNGTEVPMPEIDQAAALRLGERSFEFLPARLTPELFKAFCAAVDLWRWNDGTAPQAFRRRWLPATVLDPKKAAS